MTKEHEIIRETRTAYDGKPLDQGLIRLICRCGWAVCHSVGYAKLCAELHIDWHNEAKD